MDYTFSVNSTSEVHCCHCADADSSSTVTVSIRSINHNIHESLSISCKNTETLGCQFSSFQNNPSVWGALLCCTTRFTLTWFHFSQELSPLARLSLLRQNPQRLDFPFIWLWFTRPFWPSSQFTYFYHKHIDPQVKCRFNSLKGIQQWQLRTGSRIKHAKGGKIGLL